MKNLFTVAAALVFLSTTAQAASPKETIIIGHSKNKDLLVFKTEKKFAGALVEVYTSQGELLTSQHLLKRKMIIDFGSVMKDTYTIRVVKGNAIREYQYIKK
jgi:hypothetical protein